MISILLSLLASPTLSVVLSILILIIGVLLLSPGLLGDTIGVIGLSTGFLGLLTPWFGTPLITIASILYSTNLVMTGALEGVGVGGPIIAVVTFLGTIGALIADLIPGVNTLFATIWLPMVSFLYPVLFTLLVGKPWQGFIHLVLLAISSIAYWLTGLISPVTGITVFLPFVFFILAQCIAFALDFNPTTGLSTLAPTMLSAFSSILVPVVGPTTALVPMATVAILGVILLVVFYVISWPVGLLEAAVGIGAMVPTSILTFPFASTMVIIELFVFTALSPFFLGTTIFSALPLSGLLAAVLFGAIGSSMSISFLSISSALFILTAPFSGTTTIPLSTITVPVVSFSSLAATFSYSVIIVSFIAMLGILSFILAHAPNYCSRGFLRDFCCEVA